MKKYWGVEIPEFMDLQNRKQYIREKYNGNGMAYLFTVFYFVFLYFV